MVPSLAKHQSQLVGFGSQAPKVTTPGGGARNSANAGEKQDARTSRRGDTLLKSLEEIRNDPEHDVKDDASARRFLLSGMYVPPNVPFTMDVLANVILGLTQAKGVSGCKTTQVALRSVAFILSRVDHDSRTDAIMAGITERLDARLADVQTDLIEGITKMESSVREIVEKAGTAMDDVRDAVEGATQKMEGATKNVQNAIQNMEGATQGIEGTTASYKEALIKDPPVSRTFTQTSTIDPRLRAREGIRQRQILIDLITDGGPSELKECAITTLVEAANKALRTLDEDTVHKVAGASRLRNGGILLEMGSTEAALWLKEAGRTNKFVAALEPGAKLKARLYPTIAQFVPVSFGPENESEIHEIEDNNGMTRGDIGGARWIKPVERRQLHQTMAHLAIKYTSPEAANRALLNGIFICGTRTMSIKGKREPIRCLKCHGWDHLAAGCTKSDKCGSCAGDHRTSLCNSREYFCIPCKSGGHASWSRDCPTFRTKCAQMDSRLPENGMPFFPTNEEWTQVAAQGNTPPFGQSKLKDLEPADGAWKATRSNRRSRGGSPASGSNTQIPEVGAPVRYVSRSTPERFPSLGSWDLDNEDAEANPSSPLTNV